MSKKKTNGLERIEHIVVLMLENRSFDNLLGWLYADEAPPRDQHFEGLTPDMWNPLENRDSNGVPFIEKVVVRRNGAPTMFKGKPVEHDVDFTLPRADPGEGFRNTNHQLFEAYEVPQDYPPEPTMQGFVNNYRAANLYSNCAYNERAVDPREIMICYTPEQVPVLSKLARHYAVCDKWFCSVPSQTLCNRDFVHAATSTGHVNNSPLGACDAETIYNRFEDAIRDGRKELSWRIYGSNPLTKPENEPGHEADGCDFSLTRIIMTRLQDESLTGNFQSMNRFFKDCKAGRLPSYSFLEPTFAGPDQNDQHPPSDVRAGEKLIADVYHAVSRSPQWEQTLLVITYDEHGGCYDHVPPPEAMPPDPTKPAGEMGFLFNRMGVRVPAVLVSPFIRKGTVCRPEGRWPFDHTSIIATAIRAFGLGGALTERDRAAPDLGCALTLKKPRDDTLKLKPRSWKKKDVGTHEMHHAVAKEIERRTGRPRKKGEDDVSYMVRNHCHLYRSKA